MSHDFATYFPHLFAARHTGWLSRTLHYIPITSPLLTRKELTAAFYWHH